MKEPTITESLLALLPLLAIVLALLTLYFTWENDRRLNILREQIDRQISQQDSVFQAKDKQ